MKLRFIIILILFTNYSAISSNDSLKTSKESKVFGSIHTNFNYGTVNKKTPKGAFELSTALIGLKTTFNKKVSSTLILDVTRTTNGFETIDGNGNLLTTSYFEGSKYTAFLKMAEIKWNINKSISLSVGQLLNSQYLTLQDKFWKHRYVLVTFQEAYRFGMPADFGARFKFSFFDNKLSYDIGAFNGEGPFKYQDVNGKMLISNNIVYTPNNNIILKFYYGTEFPPPSENHKNIYSSFLGFKHNEYRIGLEYNFVENYNFGNINYSGLSAYGMYDISKKIEMFFRYDFIEQATNLRYAQSYLMGFQYKPVEHYYISINYRYTVPNYLSKLYVNFGIRF